MLSRGSTITLSKYLIFDIKLTMFTIEESGYSTYTLYTTPPPDRHLLQQPSYQHMLLLSEWGRGANLPKVETDLYHD
jgi:hypothetical protein